MPNKKKKAKEDAIELLKRKAANNGLKNQAQQGARTAKLNTTTTKDNVSTTTSQTGKPSTEAKKSFSNGLRGSQRANTGVNTNSRWNVKKASRYDDNFATTTTKTRRGTNRRTERYDSDFANRRPTTSGRNHAGNTIAGAVKQWVGGQISSVGTTTQELETTARSYNKAKFEGGNDNYSLRSRSDAEKARESRNRSARLKEGINLKTAERVYGNYPNSLSRRIIGAGDSLIEKGTRDINKAKEGLGSVGKLAVDLGANATQMAGDRMMAFVPGIGQALAMGSLMNRAGGTASYEARQLGMNPDQQFIYQQGTALIEGLSEGIFNSVSAFRATYGKGAFSLADRVSTRAAASNIVQNVLKTDFGKSFAVNLSRLGAEMFEEGIEEVVADLAEPALKYALMKSTDPTTQWEGYNPKDIAYDFLVGALMAGLPGGVDVARNISSDIAMSQAYADGQAHADNVISQGLVQNRVDANGKMAKTDAEVLASQLQHQRAQGKDILPSQTRMLERAIGESSEANARAFEQRSAENEQRAIEEGTLRRSTGTYAEEAAYSRGERTVEDKNTEKAKAVMGENPSESSATAVGRVLTGTATNDDIDTILTDPEARRAVEALTGETLSANNSTARQALENIISINEIANKDAIREEVQRTHVEDIAAEINMSKRGGDIFAKNYGEAVSVIGNPSVYEDVFTRLYANGSVKESNFEEAYNRLVLQRGGAVAQYFTEAKAREAFNAGRMAMITENGKISAKAVAEKASQKPSGITFEGEAKSKLSSKQINALTKFAERANVHIRVVETMSKTLDDGTVLSANGAYKDGTIYIAADADNKLITVAKHELTHHIKKMSPERYQELEDFVFQKWYNSDTEAMEDEIRKKQLLYADITVEEAREEIIADASEAFFTDEGAIQEVCSFSKKLGRAIHDGIKTLLDTFLDLQDSDNLSKRGYGDFLDDIGILREAERMWLEALEDSRERGKGTAKSENIEALEGENLFSIKEDEARWTEDRIDNLISEYGAPHDDRYSKAYAVLMNPRDFLKLTLSDESLDKWNESARNMPDKLKGKPYRENVKNVHDERLETGVWIHDNENYPIDYEELARQRQTPFLEISSSNGTMVDGHEGRHRMRALMEAGIKSVPVVIRDTDTKYTKDHVKGMSLSPQDFGRGAVNNGERVHVTDLVPIKESNRAELIEKFGGEADVKFSLKESDQAYMDAVNKGDMETAQRMVDEEAKRHGYDTSTKLYHGTNAEFNVFKSGFGQYGEGVYFTYSKDVAKDYARDYRDLSKGRVISVYTKPLNTADWEDLGNVLGIEDIWDYFDHLDELDAESDITNLEYHPESIDALIEAGFNSFIDDGNDGVVIFPTGEGGISSMVKSADPVTYDDNGNVIPLSKRFTEMTDDIRYSLKDSDGNKLTEAQAEYFKDSKVRDENGNLLVLYHGTDSAGFNIFKTGVFNGLFFSSSQRTADAYGGNWEGKIYDPNEVEQKEKRTAGRYTKDYLQRSKYSGNEYDDFYFDSQEDLDSFINEHPGIEDYKDLPTIDADYDSDEISGNEYDRLRRLNKEVSKDYARYEASHSRVATWQDVFDHPEDFSKRDLARALYAYDREVSIDEFDEPDTKADLLEVMKQIVKDHEGEDYGDYPLTGITFDARLPFGSESEITHRINNRTYKTYVNLKNPYIVDAHGEAMNEYGHSYYHDLEHAMETDKYDGFIAKNVRIGKYGDEGYVVVAKSSNQVKLTSNENPTDNDDIRYSLSSSFEAVGCDIRKENGLIRAYDGDGNEVKSFKPSDIRRSPLGRLLTLAANKKILSDSDVTQQANFLSRLYNMILNTQDPDLIWAVSGTIGYDPRHGIGKDTGWLKEAKSKFASITGNADPQYKTTIDFTTICVKTQAIIDAMSKVMIDLGRGLTEHEIIDIVYKETARAGEQVPCPVCYVFSRWVGLGNLFGKIKEFQQDYPEDMDMTAVRKEYESIKKEVDKLVKEQTGKKSSGKARDKLYKETIERKDLLDLKDQMPNKKLTEAERKELEDLNRRLEILDHWSWLEKTRLADDYKAVPDDVLFDLNAGRTFATDYPATWRFRTTRGPALGKAVAPYSPSRLGDTIRGIASPSTLAKLGNSNRVFLNKNGLTKTARNAYNKAIDNAKRQNRMNGQRLQSTSDFRFEYGLDYLLSFIELEAIGAKAQMYTKVPEAVKFLASTGTEVNCSIMAKGSGLDEKGELVFSDITGMSWEDALMLSQMYDNVQPILVAIGREHLIKAMAHKAITMIIPYHASGSSEDRYRSMMEAVGEAVEDRTDFAEYENEHDKEDATPEQKVCRKLRIDILTGKFENKSLDDKEQAALKNNKVLHQLYIRIYGKDADGKPTKPNRKYVENYDKDGNDSDCLGVYLTKEQAGVMMPYEYWDKHSTIKDADEQGKAYIDYCESLGITPVFSGWDSKGRYHADMDFTSYTGYWKTLIDRCMYNNDGTYHKQQAVNVRNVDLDMLDSNAMKDGIFKPMQTQDAEKTQTIAERSKARIAEEESESKFSLKEDSRVMYTPSGIEVIQNPTDREFESLRKAFFDKYPWLRGTGEPPIRYTYDEEGNEYVWSSEAMHRSVEPYINEHWNTRTSQQWKWYERPDKDDYPIDYTKYQLKDPDSKDTIASQNTIAKLEDQVKDLKAEFKRTDLKTADQKQVRIQAGKLIKRHDSNMSLHAELQDTFNKIFRLYKEKGTEAFDEVYEIAKNEAVSLVNGIGFIHDEGAEEYKAIKDYLRTTPITISEDMKKNITDFNDFRKRYFGKLKLTNGETSNIDNVYMELAEMFPEQFTDDYVNPHDQLNHIVDVLDNFAPYYETLDGASEEMQDYVVEIASDIMETAYGLQTKKTFADKKYEEKIKAVQKAREKALETRNKALDRQKKRYEEKISALKEKNADYKEQTRENAEKKRRIKQISNVYKRLLEKLNEPSDTKHLPNNYAPVVTKVLSLFDFTTPGMEKWAERNGEPSKRYKYMADTMLELRKQLEQMSKTEGSELEVDPDLLDIVDEIMADMEENQRLADMDSNTLEDIAVLFRAFERQINSYNKAFDENNKQNIAESAYRVFDDISSTKKAKWRLGVMGRLMTSNFNPSDFFTLIGGEVEGLYNATRKGFDRYVDHLSDAKDFIQDTVKAKTADKWANHTGKYKTASGEEITLTDAQLMGLYCLSRREQAQNHIYYGGIISAPVKAKGRVIEKTLEEKRVIPTQEDLAEWFKKLSPEQMNVAEKIQKYLSTEPAEWGNETSMKLYGYRKFNEQMYYPIQSSKDYLDSNFDGKGTDPTLKNISPTKATVRNANNAIVVDDIFTVFSKHIAQMASYNAYVPAITDFQRVWNYTEGNDRDKVKAKFADAYGRNAANYIEDFFKNLNGVYKNNFDAGIFDKGLGLFKKAAVGGNIRVLVQQPTAIARAALIINPVYLTASVPKTAVQARKVYGEMMEHCPIAKWKSWGFYSSDITSASRDLRNIMIGKDALTDKVFMDMYGVADNATWTVIFNACKMQVEAKNKGLKKGSDEYWEKVNELASEVFDRTQVVDSPFHRSAIMKSQDKGIKMVTAFMAEPTKTVNMINTEMTLAARAVSEGHPAKAAGVFARVGMVVTANAALLAVAQALVDAMRGTGGDDDKDKGKYKDRFKAYWKEDFVDNVNLFGMIPFVKDVKSLWDGYDIARMDMNGIQKVIQSIQYLKKYYANPDESKYTKGEEWRNLALTMMYAAGVPISNAKRDLEAATLTAAEATNNPDVMLWFMKQKYQVNDKTKSLWISAYFDAQDKGNEGLARNIKQYMLDSGGVTEKDIEKKRQKRLKDNPTEEATQKLDKSMKTLEGSAIWKDAKEDDKTYYSGVLEKISVGIEDTQTGYVTNKATNGLTNEEVILYKLALKKVDKPNKNGNLGTYTNDEKEEAIKLLAKNYKLTEEQKKILKG